MTSEMKRIPQAAAIPIMDGKICLITSSSGKRWVIPKGIIDPGMTAEKTALQESWEEAGLRGTLDDKSIGDYTYEKWAALCEVTVFVMRVTEAADKWPERGMRERRWFAADDAISRLREPVLRKIAADFMERDGAIG